MPDLIQVVGEHLLLLRLFLAMQSEHFHSLSKEPVISSLSVFEGLDGNSRRSVEVDLYCTVCGVDKVHNSASFHSVVRDVCGMRAILHHHMYACTVSKHQGVQKVAGLFVLTIIASDFTLS